MPWPEEYDPATGKLKGERELRRAKEERKKKRLTEYGLPGGLPLTAAIADELRWVAGFAHADSPDLATAPSVAAVGMWRDVRADDRFRQKFWELFWRSRLPEMRKVSKESPLAEDGGGENQVEFEAELRKRLFGLGGEGGLDGSMG